MANFSLYISGQTELGDVTEFFQKRLLGEGETPIAFFDGVFYESHQERVGNIVYQDYLIFSDKALYLWARGASKDYLDRFTLGAVSVNSRNKDSAFATMNLKIRREGKEPVFVIFDMVEIREAEMIIKLQTAVESTIEDYLGVNYRQEIPPDAADRILQAARSVCPPMSVSLPLESPESPQMPAPDAGIGYGQDLLEQYRAMGGQPQGSPYGERPQAGGMGMPPGMGAPPFAPRGGLESMLPTDPASLKRIADQIKNMVGDAPFKLRDQVMKDLQHVPGDVATVLSALNELLANIAGNPMAERFVMNAIKTAVVNDGMIGSLGKIIKMTGFGSGGSKKSSQPSSAGSSAAEERAGSRPRKSPFEEESADDSSTIRRRKISVKDDEEKSAADLFAGSDEPITSRQERKPAADDAGASAGGHRKKLSIKMEDDNEIARKLMSYDESEREASAPEPTSPAPAAPAAASSVDGGTGMRRKKLSVKAEEGSGAGADVAQKLMSYDEESRGAINTLSKSVEPAAASEPEVASEPEPEPEAPVRKKIQIVASEEPAAEVGPEAASDPESEPEATVVPETTRSAASGASASDPVTTETISTPASEFEPEPVAPFVAETEPKIEPEASAELAISEEELFAALGQEPEPEKLPAASSEYMTIESDEPERKVSNVKPAEPPQQQRRPTGKSGRGKRRGKKV